MSSYGKSQQFYHVLPAAASRPVSNPSIEKCRGHESTFDANVLSPALDYCNVLGQER